MKKSRFTEEQMVAILREADKALWLEECADSTLFPSVVHGLFFQKVITLGKIAGALPGIVRGGVGV